MEKPDLFCELFRMQNALNERIGVHTGGMNAANRTKSIAPIKAALRCALERKDN